MFWVCKSFLDHNYGIYDYKIYYFKITEKYISQVILQIEYFIQGYLPEYNKPNSFHVLHYLTVELTRWI